MSINNLHTLLQSSSQLQTSSAYNNTDSSLQTTHRLLPITQAPIFSGSTVSHRQTSVQPHRPAMAAVIVLCIAAYFSAEKIHEHRQKKRANKSEFYMRHGAVVEISQAEEDNTTNPFDEPLPGYSNEHHQQSTIETNNKKSRSRSPFRFGKKFSALKI